MHTSTSTQAATTTPDLVCVLVVLLRPSAASDQRRYDELQALRRAHDQAYDRWLPHITLIPPFTLTSPATAASSSQPILETLLKLHADKLSDIVRAASAVCSNNPKHPLLLDQISTFPLRSYTNVHLRPFPTNFTDKRTTTPPSSTEHSSHHIVELQKQLHSALTPILGSKSGRQVWKPHVSLGQSNSAKATWQLCTAGERLLKGDCGNGLLCEVSKVQVMVKPKGAEGRYHILQELPLSH